MKIESERVYLNTRRIEIHDPDLSSDVSQYPKVDPVVKRGVSDQISGVGLKQTHTIDGDGGDNLFRTVSLLEESGNGGFAERDSTVHDCEPGLAVPDPHLIGVVGVEEEADDEGD